MVKSCTNEPKDSVYKVRTVKESSFREKRNNKVLVIISDIKGII